MSAFDGARDYDDDRTPGWISDALCLLLALLNAVAWPMLMYLVFAP